MKTFAAMLLSALLSGSAAWVLTDQRVEQPQRNDGWVFASIAPSAVEVSPASQAASAQADEKAAGAASRETGTLAADHGADAR